MLLPLYRFATVVASPFLGLYLQKRQRRGKEHASRMGERLGLPSRNRPLGRLIWLHAASVGEAQSILPLLHRLSAARPDVHLLLTTGTVTSARFIENKLPGNAFHQFVPIDTPQAVNRFIRHWQPELAVWTESELWPNLILTARAAGCRMALINARMSRRSFDRWRRFPATIRQLLGCFDTVSAQGAEDAERLGILAGRHIENWGNLKYDAEPLPVDTDALDALRALSGSRPLWLAASTHPGEESLLADAQQRLLKEYPDALFLLIPRHPERGDSIAAALRMTGLSVAQRTLDEPILPSTQVYLADTLGELGLFYRLSGIAFIGGSLVPHGGQNPLEAARLDCALLAGPHTQNFLPIYQGLETAGALTRASTPEALSAAVSSSLGDPIKRDQAADAAADYVRQQQGALDATFHALIHLLQEPRP